MAKSKQEEMMTEEILTNALRPLEEQKIYDDGEIGQVILGGESLSRIAYLCPL